VRLYYRSRITLPVTNFVLLWQRLLSDSRSDRFNDYKLPGGANMPTLQLTVEEASELHSILDGYFSELRMEIERTESGAFRARLQSRERLVKKLLEELKT
jgi:hypothetical protein